jgi:hypothetical protein
VFAELVSSDLSIQAALLWRVLDSRAVGSAADDLGERIGDSRGGLRPFRLA